MHLPHSKLLGFTLVELIVVITIVGILSTVGFVSYSGYLTGARDSNRYSQMTKLSDSLQTYAAAKSLPLPDDSIDITASVSTNVIAYQGYVGVDILETIDYTNGGKDPKDDSYFTYYLTKDRKSMQLLTFMEDTVALLTPTHTSQSYAADYEDRTPKTYGKKLGVLVSAEDGTINTPAQEISANTSSGYLDVVRTTDSYTAVISDEKQVTGTGTVLAFIKDGASSSCAQILRKNAKASSGTYTINPDGAQSFEVYCDMETDGGGWTRLSLLTRKWGADLGWDLDPIDVSYGTRVQGLVNQAPLNDLNTCVGDSQVNIIWESYGLQLSTSMIGVMNNGFSEGYTTEYAVYDTDSNLDWDSFKGCYDTQLVAYADGSEHGASGDLTWAPLYSVDSISGIFNIGIYGGVGQNGGYNISLPRYWYFR